LGVFNQSGDLRPSEILHVLDFLSPDFEPLAYFFWVLELIHEKGKRRFHHYALKKSGFRLTARIDAEFDFLAALAEGARGRPRPPR